MTSLGGIGNSLYYSQPFLKDKNCNSSTFLKEISYKVNLNGKSLTWLVAYVFRFIQSGGYLLLERPDEVLPHPCANRAHPDQARLQMRVSFASVDQRRQ